MLNANFGSLFRLIDNLDQEVQGHQAVSPPMEIQTLLQSLRSGNLPDDQRKELFEQFLKEPGWLAWLAEQAKSGRTATSKKA